MFFEPFSFSMSLFARVIDIRDARMCELQNTARVISRNLRHPNPHIFCAFAWVDGRMVSAYEPASRRYWLSGAPDEEDLLQLFGPVDFTELFTGQAFLIELQRAYERNQRLQELWRCRSCLVPVWWQLAQQRNLPDDALNIIGSSLTQFIDNEEHPLPATPYRAAEASAVGD